MANVAYEKKVFHVVPGGHTDAVTGANCHWNVFRVCNTTQMEANAVAGTLIKNAGKKWYYITPDYAFGHTLQAGLEKACGQARRHQGRRRSHAARHHRLLVLPDQGAGGEAGRHHLPHGRRRRGQRAEAGGAVRPRQEIPSRRRAAGTRSARRPAAGSAHRHLGVRVVLEPAERAARRRSSSPRSARRPAARCRPRAPGSASPSTWTCALAAAQAKSLDAVKMAKAMQGFKLPPEVALMPDGAVLPRRSEPAHPRPLRRPRAVQGQRSIRRICSRSTRSSRVPIVAGTLEETGCKMTWPT